MNDMPWEIVELPFRDSTRPYKRFPTGGTVVASEEDVRIWRHVLMLRRELAEARGGAKNERAGKPRG